MIKKQPSYGDQKTLLKAFQIDEPTEKFQNLKLSNIFILFAFCLVSAIYRHGESFIVLSIGHCRTLLRTTSIAEVLPIELIEVGEIQEVPEYLLRLSWRPTMDSKRVEASASSSLIPEQLCAETFSRSDRIVWIWTGLFGSGLFYCGSEPGLFSCGSRLFGCRSGFKDSKGLNTCVNDSRADQKKPTCWSDSDIPT